MNVDYAFVAPEYPHASDCAIWVSEPCDCVIGKGMEAESETEAMSAKSQI